MMRFLLAALAGAVLCPGLFAQIDVSGKWSGFPIYAIFKQDGSKVTGTAGQTEDDQIPFDHGTIEGDRLSLGFGSMEIVFVVNGDQMTGELHQGASTMKIVLKRVKPRDPGAPPPAFDAATVKRPPPEPVGKGISSRMKADPGRITCANVSLKKYVTTAWGLKDYQVSGPSWLDDERYDITATMPVGVPPDEVLAMLRTLLKERFGLVTHTETRELAVYAMVVDKGGLKLKPADGPGGSSMSGGPKGRTLKANITLKGFAGTLSGQVDRPVLDMTGTAGAFHVQLEWTPVDNQPAESAADSAPGGSIFTALHEVGLKLEPRKAPVDLLVIDRAEKIPAEN